MTLRDRLIVVDAELPDGFVFEYPWHGGTTLMGPNVTSTAVALALADDVLVEVQKGSKHTYIFGEATYLDWFDDTPRHTTTFCHKIVVEAGNPLDPRDPHDPKGTTVRLGFPLHREYNYAD
jgi:hypothetical protein